MQLGSHFSPRILLRNDNFGSPNEWSKSLSKLLNSWKGLEKDIHLKSQKYPSLFLTLSGRSVCKKVLMNISPTSVPSERAFSMAGFFMSKLRGSMNYWTTLNNPDSLKTKNWQKYFFSGKILFFGKKGTLIFKFSAKFLNESKQSPWNCQFYHFEKLTIQRK